MPTTQRRRARPASTDDARTAAGRVGVALQGQAGDVCEVACVDREKVERVRANEPAADAIRTPSDTFKALGDRTRLRIVAALAQEELCVCDLATLVEVSESAVSHSLRTLRQLRLVRYRKVGKIAYYSLDDAHVARLVAEGLGHVIEVEHGEA